MEKVHQRSYCFEEQMTKKENCMAKMENLFFWIILLLQRTNPTKNEKIGWLISLIFLALFLS